MTIQTANSSLQKSYVFPLIIIGALFFIFGFVTWANSQLIPYLKIACELTDTESFLVASAFFAAYFVMAIPSAAILKWTGFKKGMSLGLLVMAAGALLWLLLAYWLQILVHEENQKVGALCVIPNWYWACLASLYTSVSK